mgnify:CR=1 FL=1
MNENALLFLLVGGAIGYTIGVNKRPQKPSEPQKLPTNKLPKPPEPQTLPPSPEDPSDPQPEVDIVPLGQPADYSPLWADVDFEVEVYPMGVDETRVRPPSPQGLVASSDCSIIALARQWWDAVGLFSATVAFGQTDGDAVSRRVIKRWLPESCQYARTNAAGAIRAEIRERLANLSPDLVFTQPMAAPIG